MLLSDWSKSVHGVLGSQNHSVETSAAKMDFFLVFLSCLKMNKTPAMNLLLKHVSGVTRCLCSETLHSSLLS